MIVINASNVANLLGKNSYSPLSEAFIAAWKSSDKSSYKIAHKRNGVLTKDELIEETLQQIPDAFDRRISPMNAKSLFIDENAPVRPVTKKHIETAKYLYNTSRGVDKEEILFQSITKILPERNFQKLDNLLTKRIGNVVLQGRVDGISSDGTCILEIKTRIHKLFMQARQYELYQVAMYFILCENATNAFLVEGYFRSKRPDLNFIEIQRRDVQDKIDEILANVERISKVLTRIIMDETVQNALLKSSRPDVVIKNLSSGNFEPGSRRLTEGLLEGH
jgi:hypothetical protein